MSTLAGLGALRHLDLQFVGVDQIIGGYTETAAGNLLHRAAAQIAVRVALEAVLILAAFPSVRHASDAIHGNCQSLVSFLADRTEAHRARCETFDDLLGRLYFFNGDGPVEVPELEQAAQGTQLAILGVEQVCIFLESCRIVLAHGMLNLADRQRVQQMIFTTLAILILAADDEVSLGLSERLEGVSVLHLGLASQYVESHSLNARCGA